MPPYGGSIEQNVYYADADLCDPLKDYSRGGYPTRENDESGTMAEPTSGNDEVGTMAQWKAPYILMVDRGACTFVKKARNAQKLGASAVVIADSTCLCVAGDDCVSEGDSFCETKEPIMADDGSGSDVTIPSFLMFKQDADPVKDVLQQNKIVRMQMSWKLPNPDSTVKYLIWTTPTEPVSLPLQKEFRHVAKALGKKAQFTPHMYIYNGIYAGCKSLEGENQCFNLCTNVGRYCASDPNEDLDKGISGADVVAESLRRICIWNEYGAADGIGMPWWDYVGEFLFRCIGEDFFTNDDCIKDAMKRASVDHAKIQKCMDDSGGLEGDVEDTLLNAELLPQDTDGVVIMPSIFVNDAPLRGKMSTFEVFEAICSGYLVGSEPDSCKKCRTCDDVQTCVSTGRCPGDNSNTVSIPVFMGTLFAVMVIFSVLGVVQWQRSQRQIRLQVRGIVAEYMPIDPNVNVESLGIPDDEDDDGDLRVEVSS